MPAHKRYPEVHLIDDEDDDEQGEPPYLKKYRVQAEQGEVEDEGGDEAGEEEQIGGGEAQDSDVSRSFDDIIIVDDEDSEWVYVSLDTVRSSVQCPICLGIIKKTRTMMDCLHRFCRECIDKSMRLGNNECPACRKHCASRRSLRDDPRYDTIIVSLYGDLRKYEEEEMALEEEEKARNKQIQATIAKISQKQTEAAAKRNKMSKDTHSASNTRVRRKYTRRKRRNEPEESEDNEDEDKHNVNKDSSSADERRSEPKTRRYKRRTATQASPSAAQSDCAGIENELEAGNKEGKSTPGASVRGPEKFAWGGAGARSKFFRQTRFTKLNKYLESKRENGPELDVNLMLIPADQHRIPTLQQLFFRCPSCWVMENIREYIASETEFLANDLELLLVKKFPSINYMEPILNQSTSVQLLQGEETLAEAKERVASDGNRLILAYRLKEGN